MSLKKWDKETKSLPILKIVKSIQKAKQLVHNLNLGLLMGF